MNRLSVLLPCVLAGCAIVSLCGPSASAGSSDPLPNIILCMADDQGWGDVSYNGLKQIRTPHLDAMAEAGLRFNRFYAQQSCSPTRASVLTGRHPNRQGVFWPGMRLRVQESNLAQAMKHAGYVTAHFGKWHLNGIAGPGKIMTKDDPLSPGNVGFDESFSVSNYFEIDWVFGRNGVPEKTTGDGSDVIVAEALNYAAKMSADQKPFFAAVWFGSPHIPCKPLEKDLKAAGGSGYYGEVLAMDRSMGALRSGLRKMGIEENTIVWFCSDNGGALPPKDPTSLGTNGNLRGRKAQVWEGGIRVPCILEWPAKIKKPFMTDVPAGVIDIYPTLVDIVKAEVPNQVLPLDGISLVPLLEGKMDTRPTPMGFWQGDSSGKGLDIDSGPSAWNDNRYKLVKLDRDQWALYDLIEDISESTDISAEKSEVFERMKSELNAWQLSVISSFNGENYPEKKVIQPYHPHQKKKQP